MKPFELSPLRPGPQVKSFCFGGTVSTKLNAVRKQFGKNFKRGPNVRFAGADSKLRLQVNCLFFCASHRTFLANHRISQEFCDNAPGASALLLWSPAHIL